MCILKCQCHTSHCSLEYASGATEPLLQERMVLGCPSYSPPSSVVNQPFGGPINLHSEGTSDGTPAKPHVRCSTFLLSHLPGRHLPAAFACPLSTRARSLPPLHAFAHHRCQPFSLHASCSFTESAAHHRLGRAYQPLSTDHRTCFELLLQLLSLLLLDAGFQHNRRLFHLCHICACPLTTCDTLKRAARERNSSGVCLLCPLQKQRVMQPVITHKAETRQSRVWVRNHAPAPWPPSGLSSSSCGPP